MKVLVCCEESQEIAHRFAERGWEAYSCDLLDCSGGRPDLHIKQDVLPLLNGDCEFDTCDGKHHKIDGKWDLLVCHPVCTFLTTSGNRWFDEEKYGDKARKRKHDRQDAIDFFMSFINADCEHIAVENPIGIMSTQYRKPDQIIHPWMFGDPFVKNTCLWLKGLPTLEIECTKKPEIEYKEWIDKRTGKKKRQDMWSYSALSNAKTDDERQRIRSRTFPGIARAIVEQWGDYLEKEKLY